MRFYNVRGRVVNKSSLRLRSKPELWEFGRARTFGRSPQFASNIYFDEIAGFF